MKNYSISNVRRGGQLDLKDVSHSLTTSQRSGLLIQRKRYDRTEYLPVWTPLCAVEVDRELSRSAASTKNRKK